MKKVIVGVMVVIVVISTLIFINQNKDKFEYYDTNNTYGTSKKCKVSDFDELVCKKGKEWIKVNQYSLVD